MNSSQASLEIFIARHGQNQDNLNGILNGHRDLPLTELGKHQAKQLADGISDIGLQFDAIYTSPLIRAKDTAEIVAKELGIAELQIMPELIERDFGVMTGIPVVRIEELCAPDIIKSDPIIYFLNPEGAETFPELVERGHVILNKIRKQKTGGKILLVCHGDIGKMIYAAATGLPWQDVLANFHFGNCELIDIADQAVAHKIKLPQTNS